MKVKFTNLYKLAPQKRQILSKITTLVKGSNFVGGSEVEKFETNFAKYTNIKNCISLANGTDALEIALKSLNLKKGSEVIVPVNTWIATAEAVVNNGHKLVFCDINLNDYSISLADLKMKITNKTRAIIAVHLYGIPTNVLKIKKIIKNKNIKIIEDCAQAHGSKIGNKHVGTMGDIGTFSFFPGKNLGAFGDGGAIITNSDRLKNYCLRARNHGAIYKYDHKFPGRNSRLDTIQAGILNIKLSSFKKVLLRRNHLANIYYKELKNINHLNLFNLNKNISCAYHQFVIRTEKRDRLQKYLKKHKIDTMIHYPYMLNELNFFPNGKKLTNSYKLGKKILSLPISEEHSEKEILYISKKIKQFFIN